MQAAYFGGMAYGPTRERTTAWPVPNELFEPEQALRARDESFREFELADELGFDWVSLAEHHFSPNSLAPNLHVLAAALSQRLKRAKIAVLGPLLPLNNPVRIAEEVAMLDVLTGGRVIVALLRGAPYEYVVYNVDPSESRSRFEEAWELIYKAWTDKQPFGWEGEHYHFRNVSIWPRPIQQPTPPIFMSGSSKDSGEFAARKHVGLGLAFTTLALATEAARFYRERCAEYGWTPAPEQMLYRTTAYVAESDDKAAEEMRPSFGRPGGAGGIAAANRLVVEAGFFGQRDANLTRRFQNLAAEGGRTLEDAIEMGQMVCGSQETVAKQIKRLHDEIGCGVIELGFPATGGRHETKERSMTLFAQEVLPAIREI